MRCAPRTTSVVALGLALLLLAECRSGAPPSRSRRKAPAPPDAALPARVAPRQAPQDALATLAGLRPAGARLWVALRAPAAWLRALEALTPWLTSLPDLGPRVGRLGRSLAAWLGAFPPTPDAFRALGVDPDGGVAFAWLPSPSEARRYWMAIGSGAPDRLLDRMAGRPAGGSTTLELPWGDRLHCRARRLLVECASDAVLLGGPRAGSDAKGEAQDALFGYQGEQLVLRGSLWRSSEGPRATLRLEGRVAGPLGELLASPRPLPPPPPDALVALFFRLDQSRLSGALGWLPASWTSLRARQGPPISLASLAAGSDGSWWLGMGSWGWRLGTPRTGGPAPFAEPTQVRLASGATLFVRTGPKDLVLGSSAAACAPRAWGRAGGAGPPSAGTPSGSGAPDGSAPSGSAAPAPGVASASLALWLASSDPLEWLPEAERARIQAALLGLGDAERSAVDAARALMTALGELSVRVRPSARGVELELSVSSPFAGSGPARDAFAKAWQEKWRRGGFYSPETLARLAAAHPGSTPGRIAQLLGGLTLHASVREALVDLLLGAAGRLRWPEVPCAKLSARLSACLEAFGRQVEPDRWLRLDRLRQLGEAGDLGEDLKRRARKGATALSARCDARAGRLEAATALGRCFALPGCAPWVSCLLGILSPPIRARPRRPGSPR